MLRRLKTSSAAPLSDPVSLSPAAAPLVRISLLGGLRIERPNAPPVTRFPTQKTAALLAYLALYPARAHGREFLIDQFWPEAALEDGRRSLRTALASLRRQLEPPGTPMGTLLVADRATVRLNAPLLETDVARFENASLAEPARTPAEEEERLDAALAWHGGPLLPGFYYHWVEGERERLADLYRSLLLRRSALAEQRGGFGGALDYARRAVNLEQDRATTGTEEVSQPAHVAVIRLLARTGRPDDARRHYDALAERLRDLYDEVPSDEARAALAAAPAAEGIALGEDRENEAPVLAAPSPPRREPAKQPVSLPFPLTRFFGRGPEQDQLTDAFSDPHGRLVTLTGPGGSGKTRLAIEWARRISGASPAAACFVPLADLAQANYLWAAIAQALGLDRLPDPGAVRAQVIEALNGRAAGGERASGGTGPLLILDNFEAWVDAGAPLVESLLQAVPRLRVVVTSRRRLLIGGEREIPVGPLPAPTLPGTPERLLEWAAVQLFVDRAQTVRPDFQLTPRNAETITTLCQRLEGIPLALELTAAWAGALSPAQMLERISARLLDEAGPPLARQRAQRPERHRTLRAALDTSFSLLPPALQSAFARLSVFRGGWTLDAAEKILEGLPGPAADVLSRLRERSLIVAEASPAGDALRFRLLAVLREFAAEALASDERRAVQRIHAEFFLRRAEAASPRMSGPDAKAQIDALEAEHDNIRAALEYLLTSPEDDAAEEGLRLAGAMGRFWDLRGFWDEGVQWLDRALDRAGDAAQGGVFRARALMGKGRIAYQQSAFEVTRAAYEEALAVWRNAGDEAQVATLLLGLAGVAFHADNDYARSRALIEESLVLWRKRDDRAGIASALYGLNVIAQEQGDYDGARSCLHECVEIERALGNRENLANALFSLGNLGVSQVRLEEAQAFFEESLHIQRDLGNQQRIGHCWGGLGNVALERGDYATARDCFERSLQIARQLGENWAIAILLNNLGKLAYYQKDLPRAESLCRESLRLRAATSDRLGVSRMLHTLALIAAARPGTQKRAAALWGAAHRLQEEIQAPVAENNREEYEEAAAATRAALGDGAFEAAWARGAALPFDEIIAHALDGIYL